MANVDRATGFRPVKYLNGTPWNGQVRTYEVPAANSTSIFLGDLVSLSTDAPTGEVQAVMVAAVATNTPIVGVIVGVDPVEMRNGNSLDGGGDNDLNLSQMHVPASTQRFVFVVDDPNVIFEAQEDSAADPVDAADIGLNCTFVNGGGSTSTGTSSMEVDSSSPAVTADLPLKLMGIARRPDNEYDATSGSAKVLVKINNHQYTNTGVLGA